MPSEYCYKYNPVERKNEKYQQDSDGDIINVAMDGADLPEIVASSNLVTPKYLVHAKKAERRFVKIYNFFLSLMLTIDIVLVIILILNTSCRFLDDQKTIKIFGLEQCFLVKAG